MPWRQGFLPSISVGIPRTPAKLAPGGRASQSPLSSLHPAVKSCYILNFSSFGAWVKVRPICCILSVANPYIAAYRRMGELLGDRRCPHRDIAASWHNPHFLSVNTLPRTLPGGITRVRSLDTMARQAEMQVGRLDLIEDLKQNCLARPFGQVQFGDWSNGLQHLAVVFRCSGFGGAAT